MQVEALLFGPGLPPSGSPGMLVVDGTTVRLHAVRAAAGATDVTAATPIASHADVGAVQLREVGFGRPGLEFAWESTEGRWAAHVLDPESAERVLASPTISPTAQASAMRAARRGTSVRRSFGWTAVALFVLFPVLLVGLFLLQSDRIADWAIRRVPIETEVRLGRAAFDELRTTLDLQTSGPAYDAVQAIGRRLTKGSKYRYEFHVARNDEVNAFALPGGIVVVHTGLIATTRRPEELAGVLAHEVQHVELRHSLRGVAKSVGLRALWAIVTGDVGGTLAGEAALQLTALRFSRGAEEQADADGFALLVDRGIDPSGMQAFFSTLEKTGAAAPPALLSTHPASEERSRRLATKLAALGPRRFEPLSFGAWPPR